MIRPSPAIPRIAFIALFSVVAISSVSQACLWDWDTLQMERRRFPGVLEMITGKFVRHSPAYYEWRIHDRTKRIRSPDQDPELADDLAVAYAKLGRRSEALAILEQALAAHPDRYETLSNLGTIHMLAGDLKTGKEYIDRAIAINPNAHFGREKYQSLLAEYFLAERTAHNVDDVPRTSAIPGHPHGFARVVLARRSKEPLLPDDAEQELEAAQKGVLGMMHFADYNSPTLLEALGDLLSAWPNKEEDAKQLAARAYFQASQQTADETSRRRLQSLADSVLGPSWDFKDARGEHDEPSGKQKETRLEKLSAELDIELTDARKFTYAIAADEQRWILQRANVDEEFAAKYYESLDDTIDAAKKQLSREWPHTRGNVYDAAIASAAIVLALVLAVPAFAAVWLIRRRRSRPADRQ